MMPALHIGAKLTARGLLHHGDTLHRVAETLSKLPASWQGIQTRADLFAALEAAYLERDDDARRQTWEKIRYLSGFPEIPGTKEPLHRMMRGAQTRDPFTDGELPTFSELLAALNRAAGWTD